MIDVRIPYNPNGDLGAAYNRVMKETSSEWVLFLDHDVLLLNPHWYHICQYSITNNRAGMFTCWTNRIGRTGQRDEDAPKSHDVLEHKDHAKKVWENYGYSTDKLDKASGFFMLVNKHAWKQVNFESGFFKVDWNFSRKLIQKKWPVVRINGLYVYHMRNRTGSWIEGQKTALELKNV